MSVAWHWTTGKSSKNSKTGKIPTAFPASVDAAWQSCEGCVLREGKHTVKRNPDKPQCYFWYGQGRWGLEALLKAHEKGKDHSLEQALLKNTAAKAVRMSGGGDPSATAPKEYKTMRALVGRSGKAWIDYTHFWQGRGAWLKGMAMASCDTWEQAIEAVRQGWRATVHVPSIEKLQGQVEGIKYTVCPNQRPAKTTCNDCRLCDASRQVVPIIVFVNH